MNSIKRSATHTFALMAMLTLLSKFMGFVREMIMANFYGASYVVDSYVISIAIPGIIFGGVFGAVSTAYMPTYSVIREKEDEASANVFTSQVLNLLVFLSIIGAAIGIIFSDTIVAIFASGFSGETARLTSFFIKITFTYVIFSSTSQILDAFLHYRGIFLKPIFSNYFQNIALISVIVISAFSTYYILAFGTLIGLIIRLIYLSYIARKEGLSYTLDFNPNKTVRNIFGLAIPVFIGSYINQINSFVDKTLASGLPEGSVAALNYSMILITLFTGLTVSLLITMIYPKITKASTKEDWDIYNSIIERGMNIILLIAIPVSLGILAFSNEAVQIVYERGAFDPNATKLTSGAFFYYGLGLTFFALNELLIKVYYSMQNTKVPIICSGITVLINISLNLLLIDSMAHRGLALATSVSALSNTIMLYSWMRHKYPKIGIMKSKRKLLKIISSSILAVGAAYFVHKILIEAIFMPRMLYLGIAVFIAIVVYLLALWLFKIKEIQIITDFIKLRRR